MVYIPKRNVKLIKLPHSNCHTVNLGLWEAGALAIWGSCPLCLVWSSSLVQLCIIKKHTKSVIRSNINLLCLGYLEIACTGNRQNTRNSLQQNMTAQATATEMTTELKQFTFTKEAGIAWLLYCYHYVVQPFCVTNSSIQVKNMVWGWAYIQYCR